MECGADPNAYDEGGETPVHCAAAAAQPVVVREFEKRGSDRHLPRRADGKTAAEILLPPPENAEVRVKGLTDYARFTNERTDGCVRKSGLRNALCLA